MMKNSPIKMISMLLLVVGIFVSSAQAELGLSSIFSSQGIRAVGLAVMAAVEGLYASDKDPAEIEQGIVDIVNEAVETGNEQIVQYTIVAVMMGGGTENLDTSRAAINNSQAFSQYPGLVADVVSQSGSLISSGGETQAGGGTEAGGGAEAGGDQQSADDQGGGGLTNQDLGGGDPNPFEPGAESNITDGDTLATPI